MVLPSMQQAKVLARGEARNINKERKSVLRQAAWYGRATASQPFCFALQVARADEVWLHRLRLGYPRATLDRGATASGTS